MGMEKSAFFSGDAFRELRVMICQQLPLRQFRKLYIKHITTKIKQIG